MTGSNSRHQPKQFFFFLSVLAVSDGEYDGDGEERILFEVSTFFSSIEFNLAKPSGEG